MKDMIKLLNKNLRYEKHEITCDEIRIWAKSRQKVLICPCCGRKSRKAHSSYRRTIQDLPISGKKVYIEITSRKMLCPNAKCNRKTFAEKYDFVGSKGKKSLRLEKEIINIAMNSSSTEAARMLKVSPVSITICILWIARSGSAWRDLPERYGSWKTVYSRFCKWRDDGTLVGIFKALNAEADYENLSIDSTVIKAHQHSAGAKKGL